MKQRKEVQVLLTTVDFHEFIILVSPKTEHPGRRILNNHKRHAAGVLSDCYHIHHAYADWWNL
ncbi:hypothetical protein ACEQPO_24045 [Bacillus sp. SL00103]